MESGPRTLVVFNEDTFLAIDSECCDLCCSALSAEGQNQLNGHFRGSSLLPFVKLLPKNLFNNQGIS